MMDRQTHAAHSDDLNAFVDGTLSTDERARITTLLAQDPGLEHELAELRATARLMSQLPEYAPRRSFRLGEEHARVVPPPATGGILQFLPIVRTLSVAAALIFMVVAGSLFFDINGNADSDIAATFQEQGESIGNAGETDSAAGSSDDAEDAAGEDGSSMTARGDAASAGDEPMEDLTQFEESSGDVAQSSTTNSIVSPVQTPDGGDDRTSWIWSSIAFGGLALVLAGLGFMLARAGRQA